MPDLNSAGLSFWSGWVSVSGKVLSGYHSRMSFGVQERMAQRRSRLSSLSAGVAYFAMSKAFELVKPLFLRNICGFVMPRRRNILSRFIFSMVFLVYFSSIWTNLRIFCVCCK